MTCGWKGWKVVAGTGCAAEGRMSGGLQLCQDRSFLPARSFLFAITNIIIPTAAAINPRVPRIEPVARAPTTPEGSLDPVCQPRLKLHNSNFHRISDMNRLLTWVRVPGQPGIAGLTGLNCRLRPTRTHASQAGDSPIDRGADCMASPSYWVLECVPPAHVLLHQSPL